jgi:hypothetical protein
MPAVIQWKLVIAVEWSYPCPFQAANITELLLHFCPRDASVFRTENLPEFAAAED